MLGFYLPSNGGALILRSCSTAAQINGENLNRVSIRSKLQSEPLGLRVKKERRALNIFIRVGHI